MVGRQVIPFIHRRRLAKPNYDLGTSHRQKFPRPNIKRDPFPTPKIALQILSHGDLYAFHIVTVTKGLQDRVGETEEDHVVDRSFSEIMINPEDRRLLENAKQDPVQVLRRSQVTSKRLFDNYPGALSAA